MMVGDIKYRYMENIYKIYGKFTLLQLNELLLAVPGPPVGILFPEVRTTSVRLIWQPPAQPNGIILGQLVSIITNGCCSMCCFISCVTVFLITWYLFLYSLLAYQITYRRNSSSSNSAMVDVLSPSARQYTASGLKPESVYVFRLTAQTRNGWGEAAEALVVTTEKRGAQGRHIKIFKLGLSKK